MWWIEFNFTWMLYQCTRSATHKTHHPVKKSGSTVKCFLRKSSYKFKMSTFLPQQRWWHQPSRSSISWLSRVFRTSNSTDMSSKHSGTKTWERDVLKDALNEENSRERLTPSEIARKYTIIQGVTNVSASNEDFSALSQAYTRQYGQYATIILRCGGAGLQIDFREEWRRCSVIGVVRRSLVIFWHYEVKDERRFYAHMHTNLIAVEWRIC